jgi:hypothetical protein
LNLKAIEIGISHDLLAVNVKETHLISSHYSQTALNLPVLSGNSLQMRKELFAHISSTFGFFVGDLEELIGSVI